MTPTIEPGLYPNIPNADYHAGPGLSSSELKLIERSPAHYRAVYGPQAERAAPTPQMLLGSLTHALIDGSAETVYAVAPKVDRRTKEGKAAWADFEITAGGREIVTAELYDSARRMAESVLAHPRARPLFTQNQETSLYWHDTETGALCKCRPDAFSDELEILVDLKTTSDARPDAFERKVANLGYDLSAAYYQVGLATQRSGLLYSFAWVCVETEPPWAVAVYLADDDWLERGARRFRSALNRYADCRAAGIWPGYEEAIQTLAMPRYLRS